MKAIYSRSYKAKKNIANDKFYSSSWTSALRFSVVRVQNLVVSDERASERFLPWVVDILSSTEDIKFSTL